LTLIAICKIRFKKEDSVRRFRGKRLTPKRKRREKGREKRNEKMRGNQEITNFSLQAERKGWQKKTIHWKKH